MMNERNKKNPRNNFRKLHWVQTNERQAFHKKYYDNADMMELFKVSLRTLQRWRDDGIIPFKKVGGKIYYLSDKVDEMMNGGWEDAEYQ